MARIGPAFEALALQKNGSDPEFGFLSGGEGAAYYRWHLRKQRAALVESTGLAIGQRSTPLTADSRGVMLGEIALPASAPQAPAATVNAAAAPSSIAGTATPQASGLIDCSNRHSGLNFCKEQTAATRLQKTLQL